MNNIIKYNRKIIKEVVTVLGIFVAISAAMFKWGDKVIALYCAPPASLFLGRNLSYSPYCDLIVGFSHAFLCTVAFLVIGFLLAALINIVRLIYRAATLKKKTAFIIQTTKEEFAQQLGDFSDSLVLDTGYVPAPSVLFDWKEMNHGANVVENIAEADTIKIVGKKPFKGLIFRMIGKQHGLEISIIRGNYDVNKKEYIALLKWLDSLRDKDEK